MFDVVAAVVMRTVVTVVMAVVIAVVVVMVAVVLVAGMVVAVVRAAHGRSHHCRGQDRRRGGCHHCGRVKSVVAELAVPGEGMIGSIRGRSALACVGVVGVITFKVRRG
jgi:hypothetical protein